MVTESKEEVQRRLDAANSRIAELEAQLKQSGRDLDDRFRAAVDPVGDHIDERFGLAHDTSKDFVRIVGWLLVAAVVVGVLYVLVTKVF
jgi:CHASE3 domain sensor protein